ncbi:MAG: flagellar biosynthetic protein FliQ [Bryobacteraceae bacterium]
MNTDMVVDIIREVPHAGVLVRRPATAAAEFIAGIAISLVQIVTSVRIPASAPCAPGCLPGGILLSMPWMIRRPLTVYTTALLSDLGRYAR